MERSGSLPHSQEPVICPYHEPYPTHALRTDLFQFFSISPIYSDVDQVVFQVYSRKPRVHLLLIRAACLVNLIIVLITWIMSGEEYKFWTSLYSQRW